MYIVGVCFVPIGLDKTIESRELAIIARDHLTNWETLRPYLGLKRQQNKSISESHPKDYEKQKLECLEVWQEEKGNKATYGALIKAAEDARLQDLADGVRKLCKELQLHHTVKVLRGMQVYIILEVYIQQLCTIMCIEGIIMPI